MIRLDKSIGANNRKLSLSCERDAAFKMRHVSGGEFIVQKLTRLVVTRILRSRDGVLLQLGGFSYAYGTRDLFFTR